MTGERILSSRTIVASCFELADFLILPILLSQSSRWPPWEKYRLSRIGVGVSIVEDCDTLIIS